MRAFSVLEPLIKMSPEILDTFNTDEMSKGVFEMFSVNPKFINDEKVIKGIRDRRREAEEEKQQAENLRASGQGADSLARAGATAQEAGMLPEDEFGMMQ